MNEVLISDLPGLTFSIKTSCIQNNYHPLKFISGSIILISS
jgi:hypothetical protein